MPLNFTVGSDNEYFLAIAKQGIHSFMMLGVIKDDGSPQLLARVGKTNWIDPDASSGLKMTAKSCGKGTLAMIGDEGITRKKDHNVAVNYQAYTISLEQMKGFLSLIKEIEAKQLHNSRINNALINASEEDRSISCYAPILGDKTRSVPFEYKKLQEWTEAPKDRIKYPTSETIATHAQTLSATNTCRTTSLNVVECVLGFKTDISKYFFVAPKFQTTLSAGQPLKETFYILPAPPIACTNQLTKQQTYVLNKLYKRLEEIPKSHPGDPKTKEKFDQLKTIYKQIAGENNLNANTLLTKIIEHEALNSKTLFTKRSPNFLSRLFSMSSTTERLFKQMKTELINTQSNLSNEDKSAADPKKPS